jgi:hypothetical protein
MDNLSFKAYLKSKDELLSAIKLDKIHIATYEIYKYCRVIIKDSNGNKGYVNLKPGHIIKIKWLYDLNPDTLPEPIDVQLEHIDNKKYSLYQKSKRMSKWLHNYTKHMD